MSCPSILNHAKKGWVRKPHRLELERPRNTKLCFLIQRQDFGAMVEIRPLQVLHTCFWIQFIPSRIDKHTINSLLD